MNATVDAIVGKYNGDSTRLMDILIDIQEVMGCVPDEVAESLSEKLGLSKADIEQTLSFYHFFSKEPRGKHVIYLNNSAVANMFGRREVAKVFEEEAGCSFGSVSKDGFFGLFDSSCIGMSDQEPAAIIDDVIFTKLTPFHAKEIIKGLREGKKIEDLVFASYGDGNNSHPLIKSVVQNNIMKKGPVLSEDCVPGEALKQIVNMSPEAVIDEVRASNIRGRGGAGFPTGLKWGFCRRARGEKKYIFCNADEGEPGTFKDRVILTERARLLFEGMAVAAYAVGAEHGILYLRYEYKYLKKYLEHILQVQRDDNLLGKNIAGKEGFNFDIRIQLGAGAYVCGEESALIESAEGKRGEPRDRPPFPVEKGYLGYPTVVNNVETLCAIVKVMLRGGEWYKNLGTVESTGTKLLSISGDCRFPGVYEIEWGFTINEILDMVGADNVQAVQVGGPSGACIAPNEFDRILGYEDLATGGSMIILSNQRDIIRDVVLNFTEFFIDESCGSCTPCRTIPVLMRQKLVKILNGRGVMQDLMDMERWSVFMKANRCGLGHTATNPITSTLKNLRNIYLTRIQRDKEYDTGFDLEEATLESRLATNRTLTY